MINLDQHPFCIQRDFVLTYGSDAGILIEEKYCKIIENPVFLIVNLDSKSESGSHWISIRISDINNVFLIII